MTAPHDAKAYLKLSDVTHCQLGCGTIPQDAKRRQKSSWSVTGKEPAQLVTPRTSRELFVDSPVR
jgi:hypothetical protein